MGRPFERVFGDTSELRVIQFLLPLKGMEFTISELARESDVSRQMMIGIVKKFSMWGILRLASRHAGVNYYTMDEKSGFLEAFEYLNNRIVEQMIGQLPHPKG